METEWSGELPEGELSNATGLICRFPLPYARGSIKVAVPWIPPILGFLPVRVPWLQRERERERADVGSTITISNPTAFVSSCALVVGAGLGRYYFHLGSALTTRVRDAPSAALMHALCPYVHLCSRAHCDLDDLDLHDGDGQS